jgi:short-subunit dehydrogenase
MSTFLMKYGPWALVTGASSGLGAAFARHLADRKLNVVLVARRKDRLQDLAQEIERKASVQTRVVPADLSRDDFLPTLKDATNGLEINLLVNNAGMEVTGEFLANDLETELRMLQLNCRAPLILTHAYSNEMRARRRGGLIFVASIVGFVGIPLWSHYAATKGHTLLFAEGLAEELRKDGVDVLALCPGFTRTELMQFTSFGNLMSMDADAVVRVALKSLGKKRRVTAGVRNKVLAFSMRFQPRLLNTKIFRMVMKYSQVR